MNKKISIEELRSNVAKIDSKAGLAEDPLEAALRRAEDEQKAAEAAQAAIEAEMKNDGREYEYEVDGLNLGDSLVRRMETVNENAKVIKEQLYEEDLESEIEGNTPAIEPGDPLYEEDDIDGDIDEEFSFDDEVDTTPAPTPIAPKIDERKETEASVPTKQTEVSVEVKSSDLTIDDDDLLELDFEEETEEKDEDIDKEDMNQLSTAIREKLDTVSGINNGITISTAPVSLSSIFNTIDGGSSAIDFPLISAGKNITMKRFTGEEIQSLNRGNSGRNQFNALKDIYRTIYDHIVSDKPEFETWLKVTSFMDIDCIYMAIYKASFAGSNFIPYACTNSDCNHVFLSEDIDFMDMCKFKDADAKKKFMDIYNNSDVVLGDKLYPTTVVPVSDKIAIGFREPSIYNTLFENSVLDQKFINKYNKLLTIMVYIDNVYFINPNGQACPIDYKKDKNSLAKTAKYRIATYAKVIKTLPSDAFNKINIIIDQINTLGNSVEFCIPETTCPKCGKTIEAATQPASQLLFARHQLNLLSQQS